MFKFDVFMNEWITKDFTGVLSGVCVIFFHLFKQIDHYFCLEMCVHLQIYLPALMEKFPALHPQTSGNMHAIFAYQDT